MLTANTVPTFLLPPIMVMEQAVYSKFNLLRSFSEYENE